MPTTAERLDKIEADNVALNAEVSRLRAKVEPPLAPPPPSQTWGATLRTIPDPPLPAITWDNVRELRRMVAKAYPRLISMSSALTEQQGLQRFYNALHAAQNFHGTDRLDTEHPLSWWVDQARAAVEQDAGQPGFDGDDFTAAAMALNVWHREWSPGCLMEFGLRTFVPYGSGGYNFPLKEQWRETLRRGAIIPANWVALVPSR